ncbi:MAG: prepilin-type N-terminal cleavage/methylation domain-containing protein [Deltaproteobacteria bacterium]|nr:prepilin-type N-terminal cleavage/methylation domain-containing protein [Deltaproteobacteria bacterium]
MRRGRGGFTLIEIMLALGIFGLVAVTLYGTFSRTLRSKALAEERAGVTRVGRAAVGRMADEIASAYYPRNLPGTAIFRVLPGGSDEAPLDSLVFTALSARPAGLDGRATDQRMLAYFFARDRSGLRRERRTGASVSGEKVTTDGGGGRSGGVDLLADDADDFFAAFGPTPVPPLGAMPRRLLRREATMLDRRALDAARATVFVENVASLAFQFYDGHDWFDVWDSEEANARLPRAVRVDLALYDAAGAIHHFTTAVDLPLADRIVSGGAAAAGRSGKPPSGGTGKPGARVEGGR